MKGTTTPIDSLLGTVIGGRFEIKERMTEGGMGVIYLANQVAVDRTVVLKLLHADAPSDPDAIRRFFREAKAASALRSPNIVQIYDFGQTPRGKLYIAMEYCPGVTLRDLIFDEEMLPVGRALDIARQIAEALREAHGRGIIHRDLKPENVMVMHDRKDMAKLLDFGIAKWQHDEERITQLGTVLGTPRYMSPEQAAGSELDGRSDIYALGIILLEMLVGELPCDDDKTTEILYDRVEQKDIGLRVEFERYDIPKPVRAILKRCTAGDREKRPQNAETLLDTLEAALKDLPRQVLDQPVSLRGARVVPSPSAAASRLKPYHVLAVVILVVLLLGLLGLWWFFRA